MTNNLKISPKERETLKREMSELYEKFPPEAKRCLEEAFISPEYLFLRAGEVQKEIKQASKENPNFFDESKESILESIALIEERAPMDQVIEAITRNFTPSMRHYAATISKLVDLCPKEKDALNITAYYLRLNKYTLFLN